MFGLFFAILDYNSVSEVDFSIMKISFEKSKIHFEIITII